MNYSPWVKHHATNCTSVSHLIVAKCCKVHIIIWHHFFNKEKKKTWSSERLRKLAQNEHLKSASKWKSLDLKPSLFKSKGQIPSNHYNIMHQYRHSCIHIQTVRLELLCFFVFSNLCVEMKMHFNLTPERLRAGKAESSGWVMCCFWPHTPQYLPEV